MLIEAAKGGHTNVVSYLLDYPNNLLSVPAPDLSQLTPPSQDPSQVRTVTPGHRGSFLALLLQLSLISNKHCQYGRQVGKVSAYYNTRTREILRRVDAKDGSIGLVFAEETWKVLENREEITWKVLDCYSHKRQHERSSVVV